MPSFSFHRLTSSGLQERGLLDLATGDPISAMEYLERDGSVVVDVAPVPALLRLWARLRAYGFQTITRTQTAQCLDTLASYLGSGIALSDALTDLRGQISTPELRQIFGHMLVDVQAGIPLSKAMARHGHVFSQPVTTMVGVGEEVGELPAQIRSAAHHLRHMDEIAKLSRRTLAYPAVTLTVVLGVFTFWAIVVVPALANTFMDLGREPPSGMQGMLWLSEFLRNHGLKLPVGIGLTILALMVAVKKSTRVRRRRDAFLVRLPFVGPVLGQAFAARALELLGVLLGNGVDPDKSLTLTARAMTSLHYRDALEQARRLVSGGVPLSEALERGKGFQDVAIRLLHAGERTGKIKEQCDLAAAEYRRQLSHSVQMLSKMMEPFLLVIFTLLLAFFILGFLAPIYQSLGGM